MGCKFYTVFTYVRVMSEWMKGLFFISSCGTPYWMSCWASLKVSWLVKWINYDQVRVMGLLLNSGQLRKRGRPGLQWYHFSGLIVENSLQGWVKLCSCHAPRSKKNYFLNQVTGNHYWWGVFGCGCLEGMHCASPIYWNGTCRVRLTCCHVAGGGLWPEQVNSGVYKEVWCVCSRSPLPCSTYPPCGTVS